MGRRKSFARETPRKRRDPHSSDARFTVGRGHKRFPRGVTNIVRSKVPMNDSDIRGIADRFFVDNMSIPDIGSEWGVPEGYILSITRGGSHSNMWSSAVSDMISEGIECTRSPEQPIRRTRMSASLSAEEVIYIRWMHESGETAESICSSTGKERKLVCSIVSNRRYNGDVYQVPDGYEPGTHNGDSVGGDA